MPTTSQNWSILLNTIRVVADKLFQKKKKQSPIGQDLNKDRHSAEISLADLLIATNNLPWENETQLKQIAKSLGFSWQELAEQTKPEQSTKGAYDHNTYDIRPKPKQKPKRPNIPDTAPPPTELPIELSPQAQLVTGELQPRNSQETTAQIPDWLSRGDTSEFPSLLTDEQIPLPLIRDNLFSNNTSRGILSASLTVQRKGTQPDIPQIIDRIVRGEILKNIPRSMGTSIDQGCQLLLDYNEIMTPYWQDLNSLSQQVENVVGKERVQRYEFDNNPLVAKHWTSHRKSKDWQAKSGVPVLVASNVAQIPYKNTVAINDHWHKFIQHCQQKQAPLLILIPWQKEQWPTGLGSYPVFIHWNPKTTANMIRQLIGKGHEVNS